MTRIDTEKSVKICFICGSDNSLFSNDIKLGTILIHSFEFFNHELLEFNEFIF